MNPHSFSHRPDTVRFVQPRLVRYLVLALLISSIVAICRGGHPNPMHSDEPAPTAFPAEE